MAECQSGYVIVRLPEGPHEFSDRPQYRGMGRSWLYGMDLKQMAERLRGNSTAVPLDQRAAALAMNGLSAHDRWDNEWTSNDILTSMRDACTVYLTLGEPRHWEIIWVRLADRRAKNPPQSMRLGYEPAHFPMNDTSQLWDSMRYGPGDASARTLLANQHSRLNRFGLFSSRQEADEFQRLYRSLGDTGSEEFSIVEVRALSDALYRCLQQPVRCAVLEPGKPGGDAIETLEGLTWRIEFKRLPNHRKVVGIRALMHLSGMGLAEAKRLVESLPKSVVVVHVGEIELLEQELIDAGFGLKITSYPAMIHPTT